MNNEIDNTAPDNIQMTNDVYLKFLKKYTNTAIEKTKEIAVDKSVKFMNLRDYSDDISFYISKIILKTKNPFFQKCKNHPIPLIDIKNQKQQITCF